MKKPDQLEYFTSIAIANRLFRHRKWLCGAFWILGSFYRLHLKINFSNENDWLEATQVPQVLESLALCISYLYRLIFSPMIFICYFLTSSSNFLIWHLVNFNYSFRGETILFIDRGPEKDSFCCGFQ